MIDILTLEKDGDFKLFKRDQFTEFLHAHLGEYGDPVNQIEDCLSYAFSDNPSEGGFALAAVKEGKLVGAVIMNRTGMSGYIPENILVYIAVDSNERGEGIGRKLVEKAIAQAKGSVKLHVEYDNPAKRLYERIGFTTKYAEMRYQN